MHLHTAALEAQMSISIHLIIYAIESNKGLKQAIRWKYTGLLRHPLVIIFQFSFYEDRQYICFLHNKYAKINQINKIFAKFCS